MQVHAELSCRRQYPTTKASGATATDDNVSTYERK